MKNPLAYLLLAAGGFLLWRQYGGSISGAVAAAASDAGSALSGVGQIGSNITNNRKGSDLGDALDSLAKTVGASEYVNGTAQTADGLATIDKSPLGTDYNVQTAQGAVSYSSKPKTKFIPQFEKGYKVGEVQVSADDQRNHIGQNFIEYGQYILASMGSGAFSNWLKRN